MRERYHSDPVHRIGSVISVHINHILNNRFDKIRDETWEETVGLSQQEFLDYILGAGAKEETFFISENVVNNYTSIVEYPNAGLKQNRNYEVGVVLSDRFGRQSTVIFSKSRLSGQGSFLSSSIFS